LPLRGGPFGRYDGQLNTYESLGLALGLVSQQFLTDYRWITEFFLLIFAPFSVFRGLFSFRLRSHDPARGEHRPPPAACRTLSPWVRAHFKDQGRGQKPVDYEIPKISLQVFVDRFRQDEAEDRSGMRGDQSDILQFLHQLLR
jgi:hypothetical protein